MNDEQKSAFKASVKAACLSVVRQRCVNAEQAVQQAQDSANNQEKSSAGDKYETSRAMGQSDRDMNARQLVEAQRDLVFLETINTTLLHQAASTGAMIDLAGQLFFVAIGIGPLTVENRSVMVISYKSPLFELLKNKKTGDSILFQGKEQKIEDIF